MANSNSSLTTQDGNTKQDALNFLMDEEHNLSVIYKGKATEAANTCALSSFPMRSRGGSKDPNRWIRNNNCNSRITTLRQESNDALPDSRASMLAAFPDNLHFPIGALFDFANRLSNNEKPGLDDKVGLETQTILSGILYLQQQLEHGFEPGTTINNQHIAYSRRESEGTWSCYRNLIRHCCPEQRWNITLADDNTSYLPVPTLDIRLIIQNVLFTVLDDSNRELPLDVHIANVCVGRLGKNCFSMSIRVPGNPLGNVINSTYFRNHKKYDTFIFEGSGIGHIIAARLIQFLGGDIIITNDGINMNNINILIPLERGEVQAQQKRRPMPVWNSTT